MNIRVLLSSVALIGIFGIVGNMDYNDICANKGKVVVNNECVSPQYEGITLQIAEYKAIEKERKTRIIAEREYQHGAIFIIEQ